LKSSQARLSESPLGKTIHVSFSPYQDPVFRFIDTSTVCTGTSSLRLLDSGRFPPFELNSVVNPPFSGSMKLRRLASTTLRKSPLSVIHLFFSTSSPRSWTLGLFLGRQESACSPTTLSGHRQPLRWNPKSLVLLFFFRVSWADAPGTNPLLPRPSRAQSVTSFLPRFPCNSLS